MDFRVVTFALVFAAPLPALADGSITLGSSGDNVVVFAAGVHSTASTAQAHGDHIEIDLAATSARPARIGFEDDTVSRVDVVTGDRPRLSVKLHHSPRTTQLAAARTRIENTDGGIRLTIPREPRAGALPPVPTAVAAASAKASHHGAATSSAAPVAAAAPDDAPVAAAPTATSPPMDRAARAAAVRDAINPSAATTAAPASDGVGLADAPAMAAGVEGPGRTGMIVIVALMACCGLVVLFARRRGGQKKEIESIQVIASRSLGGKAKVVLVGAGGRELLLAVTDKDVQLIGGWRAARVPAGSRDRVEDEDIEMGDLDIEPRQPARDARPAAASAAVAGILRLRRQTEASARRSADADPRWTRELATARKAAI